MGSTPPPKAPEKTLKEQVQEYKKEIAIMRRQFQKESMKLEFTGKTMTKELKKLVQGKNPMANKKLLAQNIIKNQKFIAKYQNLDAQLQNTQFELQSMVTMNQMENVMAGMAKVMGSARSKFSMEKFMASMKTYGSEKEKMQMMNEMIQDTMEMDDEEINDDEVDRMIETYAEQARKKKELQKLQLEEDPV